MSGPVAIVRRPSPRLADGIVTHIERSPVDVARAVIQWQGYVDTLVANGWQLVEVPPAPDCPDSVFVEDAVVVHRGVAVVTRPGAPERRLEIDAVPAVIAQLGLHLATIDGPGTLDGGDVLLVDSTVYVGLGGRTDMAGVDQLAAALAPTGSTVVPVALGKVLHLKSAVTALPDGTIIGWEPVVDDPGVFPTFLPMPEEHGAHVVKLGGTRLLISASAPRSAELLAARGWEPIPVEIDEFEKLEGCVTCLSVRVRPDGM